MPRLAIVAILAASVIGIQSLSTGTNAEPTRPNIVFIMTDDQTVDDMRFMPKTAHLVGELGTRYTTSWTSLSWCCPSRATMKTGQHAHNHGVFSNSLPAGGYQRFDDATALPVWLQNVGYRTIHFGKAMNGTKTNIPEGWDRWQATVGGDHAMYNWKTIDEHGTITRYGTGPENYQGDVYAELAAEEIANTTEPFFMHFTPSAPHEFKNGIPTPAPRHFKTFDEPLPRPPSFNNPPRLSTSQLRTLTRQYQRRAESLFGADDAVERIVTALAEAGKLDNTVIIFTSDNGFLLGEHGANGKATFWQESMEVPLLIRGPGFGTGVVEHAPVQNIDLAPTIAALAGATPLLTVDGISLTEPLDPDRGLYFESKRDRPSRPIWEGIRTDRFVLVDVNFTNADHLWDMERDPWQLDNLIRDPAYDQVEAELRRLLAGVRSCAGSACNFTVDNQALSQFIDGPTPTSTTGPTTSSTSTSTTSTSTTTVPDTTTTTTTTTSITTTTIVPTTTTTLPTSSASIPEAPPWLPGFTVTRDVDNTAIEVAPLTQRDSYWYQVRWSVDGGRRTWTGSQRSTSFTITPGTGRLVVEVRAYAGARGAPAAWRPWHKLTIDES